MLRSPWLRKSIADRAVRVALVGLLALAGCSRVNDAVPGLNAPPRATIYSGTGDTPAGEAQLTAAQLALADLQARLREHYSASWHMDRFSVPAGTGWDAITAHYTQALGPAWKVDVRYSEDAVPSYRSKVWSNGGRAAAIALVPARRGPGGLPVLTVFTPEANG